MCDESFKYSPSVEKDGADMNDQAHVTCASDDGQNVHDGKERGARNCDPSQALVPVNMDFQGIPVRIVVVEGKKMIPVVDISKSLKIPQSTLRFILKEDPLLQDKQGKFKLVTNRGPQDIVCVTNRGAVGLLYKVNAKLSEDEETRQRILKFQNFAIDTVEEKMQTKIVNEEPVIKEAGPVSGAVTEVMTRYMESARAAHKEMGVPLDLAMAKALVLAGRDLHMDLTGFARLLPAADVPPNRLANAVPAGVFVTDGYLSASEIAQQMNRRNGNDILRGKNINKFLKNAGFVYKNEEGRWCMTDSGAQYGKVFPFAAKSGHVDYFLRWKPEVMQASGMIRS